MPSPKMGTDRDPGAQGRWLQVSCPGRALACKLHPTSSEAGCVSHIRGPQTEGSGLGMEPGTQEGGTPPGG